MNKELKALLESSVLSEDVKSELTEAFQAQVQKAVSAKEVELVEQFEQKKADLAKDTIEMIEEAVSEEFKAIQDEITEARSLDVRYAIKMEEFKEQYAAKKAAELEEMVREEISKEMSELKESLEEARKNIAGKRMFEAFQEAYSDMVSEGEAGETKEALAEALKQNEQLLHEKKLNELMEGVTGRKRRVLATLLEGVATDKLEARFNEVIESVIPSDEIVTEGKQEETKEKEEDLKESKVVLETGKADDEAVEESNKDWLRKARSLAGLDR